MIHIDRDPTSSEKNRKTKRVFLVTKVSIIKISFDVQISFKFKKKKKKKEKKASFLIIQSCLTSYFAYISK